MAWSKSKKKVRKKKARKIKKKVVKKKPTHSLGDFPDKGASAIFAAKVLFSSHGLYQAGDGNVKYKANEDGTFSITWTAKFELVKR